MDFINDTLSFLQDVGVQSEFISFSEIELYKNGTSNQIIKALLISGSNVNIESNPQAKCLLIFALFDCWIDSNFNDLEGDSYRKKYEKIPSDSENNLIIKEVFRLLKVLRNTVVHNPSQFIFDDGFLVINYEFKKTDYKLTIPESMLNSLYTMIILCIKEGNKNEYFWGVVRSAYLDIFNSIQDFSDDFETPLYCEVNGLKIRPYIRYRVKYAEIARYDGYFEITISPTHSKHLQSDRGVDFYLDIDGQKYLVPKEGLTNGCVLQERDLHRWRIS